MDDAEATSADIHDSEITESEWIRLLHAAVAKAAGAPTTNELCDRLIFVSALAERARRAIVGVD